jgi:probable rRNA maturation factor
MAGVQASRQTPRATHEGGEGPAVDLIHADPRLSPAARAWLEAHSRRALAALALTGEVRVRIVGDAEMSLANQRFHGQEGTTDVLTFDLSAARAGDPADLGRPSPRELDADILLCAAEAERQAAPRGFPVERELLLYLIHGVLHCLGHDDHDPGAAVRMHTVEDRLLEFLGVGPTYARTGGPGRNTP